MAKGVKDSKLELASIPFNGKLVTSVDPSLIGLDFSELSNMRHTDKNIRSIRGMSKINPTPLPDPQISSGFHYVKSSPEESHIIVQSYDSNDLNPRLWKNITAIPTTGNFASVWYTVDTAADEGRFSNAPLGYLAYCNGKETMLWGGSSAKVSSFINYANDDSFEYDYSSAVINTQTSLSNLATLLSSPAAPDSSTVLLLHLNNNYTDVSPESPHVVTASGSPAFTATSKFGSHGLIFDGVDDYLTIPNDSDFDFSSGYWTIDVQIYPVSLTNAYVYMCPGPGFGYLRIVLGLSGTVSLEILNGSNSMVLSTAAAVVATGSYYHIEVVEEGDDYYIFVEGVEKATTNNSIRPSIPNGQIWIGSLNALYFASIYIDELRVSRVARHITGFTPPLAEYGNVVETLMYVGSHLPVKDFNFIIDTVNTTADGDVSVYYWDRGWAPQVVSSNTTLSGSTQLGQSGTLTCIDTTSLAKPRMINQIFQYWYKIVFTSIDDTTTISNVTTYAPLQPLQELWDGNSSLAIAFQLLLLGEYNDYTTNVYDEDYEESLTSTFAQIGGMTTAANTSIYVGFTDRMSGLNITMADNYANAAATTTSVEYWDGAEWVMFTIEDSLSDGSISFSKSGDITWTTPTLNTEFKTKVEGGLSLYYYRIRILSGTLDADVRIDYLGGIQAAKEINGYKFPLFTQSRLFLCANQTGDKNSMICSAKDTLNVFNGEDTASFEFGDSSELLAGVGLYAQFGSSLYELIVIFKNSSIHIVSGTNPDNWKQYEASPTIGIAAPETLVVVDVGPEISPGLNRQMALFQGAHGIYAFDSKTPILISRDIQDVFEPGSSNYLNPLMIGKSYGFLDEVRGEYHWCYAEGSSTVLNKEKVFDIRRQRWFDISRGTKDLQGGFIVTDTNGNHYNYGFEDVGHLQRLEHSNTFDGTDITSRVSLGDYVHREGVNMFETEIRDLRLYTVAKTSTISLISVTHSKDTDLTGDSFNLSPMSSGYRVASPDKSLALGSAVYHSLSFEIDTNNESTGFEPIGVGILFKVVRRV